MSYMIVALLVSAATGIWFFASVRDQEAIANRQRKERADKRKMFREQDGSGTGSQPVARPRTKRSFGQR